MRTVSPYYKLQSLHKQIEVMKHLRHFLVGASHGNHGFQDPFHADRFLAAINGALKQAREGWHGLCVRWHGSSSEQVPEEKCTQRLEYLLTDTIYSRPQNVLALEMGVPWSLKKLLHERFLVATSFSSATAMILYNG